MRNKKIITLLLAATVAITGVAPSIQVKAEEVPGLPGVTYEDLEAMSEESQKASERDMAEDVKNSSASTNYGSIQGYGTYKVYGTVVYERTLKTPKEVKDYSNIYEWGYEVTEYNVRYRK